MKSLALAMLATVLVGTSQSRVAEVQVAPAAPTIAAGQTQKLHAMTYDGSQRIRRFATDLPDDAFVLETDAPDIPPQWQRKADAQPRNEPGELPRIAQVMAALRGTSAEALAEHNRRNARAALPRLATLLDAAAR